MNRNASDKTVYYTIQPSPIGQLLVAAIGHEVVRLAFQNQNFETVLAELQTQFGAPVQQDDTALEFVTVQLDEYFRGLRKDFELDTRPAAEDGFRMDVQGQLATIPYGQTRSYGQFAAQLDRPGAARAVGSACANNPVPLIQPCHRVVRADGSVGEFIGTPAAKNYLLAFERGETPDAPTL